MLDFNDYILQLKEKQKNYLCNVYNCTPCACVFVNTIDFFEVDINFKSVDDILRPLATVDTKFKTIPAWLFWSMKPVYNIIVAHCLIWFCSAHDIS